MLNFIVGSKESHWLTRRPIHESIVKMPMTVLIKVSELWVRISKGEWTERVANLWFLFARCSSHVKNQDCVGSKSLQESSSLRFIHLPTLKLCWVAEENFSRSFWCWGRDSSLAFPPPPLDLLPVFEMEAREESRVHSTLKVSHHSLLLYIEFHKKLEQD